MKNNKRKVSILTVCLLLTVLIAVGSTIAYIFTSTGPVKNTFIPVTHDVEVEEDEFKGAVKTNVIVTNTGDVDSFVRAKVVISWQNESGEVYPAPVDEEYYTISYGSDWTYSDADGYWYYKEAVKAKESTTALIKEAKWIKAFEEAGYTLNIEILSQSIQSTPTTVVTDKWPVSISETGVLTPNT